MVRNRNALRAEVISVHEFPLNLPEKPSEALDYLSTVLAGLAALPIRYCRPTSRFMEPAFMG